MYLLTIRPVNVNNIQFKNCCLAVGNNYLYTYLLSANWCQFRFRREVIFRRWWSVFAILK